MKRLIFAVAIFAAAISNPGTARILPRSALDGFQFDGVLSDAALKTAGWTRWHWLEVYHMNAPEYWRAWDCKDKPCDSKWQANIRAKAVLIPRIYKDPPPSDTSLPSKH